MRENIKIGLTTHPVKGGKKWVKRNLGQVDSRPKGVHVELVTDSMEEETQLIMEVMKGDSKKIWCNNQTHPNHGQRTLIPYQRENKEILHTTQLHCG